MAEEKDAKSEESGGKKKSKLKLIIILVVLIVVLVGVGLGAYLFLFKSKAEPAGDAAAAAENTHNTGKADSKGSAKKEKAKGKEAPTIVYNMGAIIVNLADQGVQRYLKVQIAIELDNPKLEEEAKKREPQIKDIIISVLSSKTVADINTPQGKIALKQEILKRINMVITEGEIMDLFFSEFIIQ